MSTYQISKTETLQRARAGKTIWKKCFAVNNTQGKTPYKKMDLVNVPTLLDRLRNIQKDRKAKPKINLRRFESNFPEQTRGRSLNHVIEIPVWCLCRVLNSRIWHTTWPTIRAWLTVMKTSLLENTLVSGSWVWIVINVWNLQNAWIKWE
jgi:hypothetical protein